MTAHVRVLAVALALSAPVLAFQGRAGGPPPVTGTPQAVPPAPLALPDGPATSVLSGVVVDGSTGLPVAGAVVSIDIVGRPLPIGAAQTQQVTDGKGRFAFVNLWGGVGYTVRASKSGYLTGGIGREKSPTDPLVNVNPAAGQWMGNLRVTIWRPAAISGMVRDEAGEPMVGIIVRTLARYRMQGRDELATGPMTVTDDRGMYRLAGLVPGRYLVQVPSVQSSMPAKTPYTPPASANAPDGGIELDETSRLVIGRFPLPPPAVNGRPMAYPIAFYPSTSSAADAATIELSYGDDRVNIDIALAPVPAVRVSGRVEGPSEAMTLLTVRLLPAGLENLGLGSEVATAFVDGNGEFTFVNVPAGSYTIDAPVTVNEFVQLGSGIANRPASFPAPPGTQGWGRSTFAADTGAGTQFSTSNFRNNVPNYSGRGTVTVGQSDLNGVVVRLKPMVSMAGHVVIEADPAQAAPSPTLRFYPTLDPAGGEAYLGAPRSQVTPDTPPGDFTVTGIMPGQYWLRVSSPTWLVKSIVWKGRDYAGAPFDTTSADDITGVVVTVTNARPTLSGVVREISSLKADDCMVVIFPVERAQWRGTGVSPSRIKTAAIGANGTYTLSSVPAGDYFVAAISRAKRATWLDPAVLTQLEASASRVSLAWGAKVTQEIPVVVIK